jgi:hypothetical protein
MVDKDSSGRAGNGVLPMPLPLGFETLMELNRPALSAMAQVNGKVYDNLAAINRNWVSFINRRLKEELAMPHNLAGCKTVQDMYGVYSEFFQTAVADYQSEFEQMTKLGKSLAEDTAQIMQARVDDATREARNGR